jgi:hypothetical protein
MNPLLLFVHFLGLMLGATGGFASAIVMRRAGTAGPAAAVPLRELGPILARVSLTGLVLMWASGLVLVWSRWGGLDGLPRLFWLKFVFVLSLTAATIAIHLTYAAIRRGDGAAAARLPKLGPAAGVSALLAVLTAAYTFSG